MSDFKMIKRAFPNLQIWAKPYKDDQLVVTAEELEEILQSAQVVKRKKGETLWTEDFTFFNYEPDEQGLLLCVEPIRKKTKAEAALEFVSEVNSGKFNGWKIQSVQTEAKRILEMKDEV